MSVTQCWSVYHAWSMSCMSASMHCTPVCHLHTAGTGLCASWRRWRRPQCRWWTRQNWTRTLVVCCSWRWSVVTLHRPQETSECNQTECDNANRNSLSHVTFCRVALFPSTLCDLDFKVTIFFNIAKTQKWYKIVLYLHHQADRKSYVNLNVSICEWSWMTSNPDFKGTQYYLLLNISEPISHGSSYRRSPCEALKW